MITQEKGLEHFRKDYLLLNDPPEGEPPLTSFPSSWAEQYVLPSDAQIHLATPFFKWEATKA